jgi:beta-galactosidase/beta-glucuronidase
VPEDYLSGLEITPDCDAGTISVTLSVPNPTQLAAKITVYDENTVVASAEGSPGQENFTLAMPVGFKTWSPASPFLYTVAISYGEDSVQSYFAMRKWSVVKNAAGKPVIGLNGKPLFLTGLLDQGYWPGGLYTPPSDAALEDEITQVKALGFNCLRKHIKIEPLRWYYWCDKLGLAVIQDMPSGGYPYSTNYTMVAPFLGIRQGDTSTAAMKASGRGSAESRAQFRVEMQDTVSLLKSEPCIGVWTIFNEGWGQFESVKNAALLAGIDSTRLIDADSGWNDEGAGTIVSMHTYFSPVKYKADKAGRIVFLSEFGGYGLKIPGHTASDAHFGYKNFSTEARLTAAWQKLYKNEVLPAKEKGLAGCIYTQVTDVEDELNGLWTYDRAVLKVEPSVIKACNLALNSL